MKLRRFVTAVVAMLSPTALSAALFLTAVLVLDKVAAAEQAPWPAGPVRLVIPYPPATSGDLIARKVALSLGPKLGTSFYVDNRPGANGNIGMKAVKDAAPDGYTFVVATDIQFAVSPGLYSNLPYDVDHDFIPVAPLAHIDNVIVARRDFKAGNLRELVASAKMRPGKITYASTGVGSTHQLFMEMLKMQGGFDMLHVPYKGTGQATPDLLSGQVDVMFFGITQTLPQVESGQLKVLAVGSLHRLEQLPDVPTIDESGFPGFESNNIWGIWAPAKTPDVIVSRLREAVAQTLAEPDVRNWYRDSGLATIGSVEEMTRTLQAQRAKWPAVIRAANISLIE